MRKLIWLCILGILAHVEAYSQKKPLDHSVYDGWQSIGERLISNDGKFVIYQVSPQEGDALLVITTPQKNYRKEIARGYNAFITEDSRFLVCKIKAPFAVTREAKIKKKKSDEMPKDSLAILELGKDSIQRIPDVKGFRLPEKAAGWLAYQLEKKETPRQKPILDSATQINNLLRMADSISRMADSLRIKANQAKTQGLAVLKPASPSKPSPKPDDSFEEGTELVLRNLNTGVEIKFPYTSEYQFSDSGSVLIIKTTRIKADTLAKSLVLWKNLVTGRLDTVFTGFNDAKNFVLDGNGKQLAFVAERDSAKKATRKFFKLWYYQEGMDSAVLRAAQSSQGMPAGMMISDFSSPIFSKDGKKLFVSITPIRPIRDTNLVEFETAKLDVWHYNDDYLQPQQLVQLNNELRRSYLAYSPALNQLVPLGRDSIENIILLNEGNSEYVLGASNKGNRREAQWQGFTRQSAYVVDIATGKARSIKSKQRGSFTASPGGNYVLWYDVTSKNYFTYNVATGKISNISSGVNQKLFDDEDDHPDDAPFFGFAGWIEDDESVLVYDRYDIWKLDPTGTTKPLNLTQGFGRQNKIVLRYVRLDRDARAIKKNEPMLLTAFNRSNKDAGFYQLKSIAGSVPELLNSGAYYFTTPLKAKNSDAYIVNRMNVAESPDLYYSANMRELARLSELNPQQSSYNWLTAELIKWKMFDGKEAEGLLFKPEDFDPKKKYPVIFYFYERNADNLNIYRQPAPSASTINITYFTSNGYIVVDPNIYYKDGNPGESAYNSVVSVARHMAKMPWVDSTRMAIQGQSWGGYQVAYLITRTNLFAAAGAGAPVANMTSAYGGIRWGTGLNRQFQYERSQSRIGATLWERQDLYIKNSPLFYANKVKTPLLIMHNDKDGAVPWYQGIEYFTALRRLGKKVWMLQYNDEDHNLVERKNRKDLSIRLAQFFDHYLKNAPAAKWITDGVPATLKGIDWGTGVEQPKAGF